MAAKIGKSTREIDVDNIEAERPPLSAVHSNDWLARSLAILEDLVDTDECNYDHHGNCQAHGWTGVDPSCPHKRAKTLLAEVEEVKAG